jgi:hypothetical protein
MGDLVQVLCFENALAFKVGMIDIVLLYKIAGAPGKRSEFQESTFTFD